MTMQIARSKLSIFLIIVIAFVLLSCPSAALDDERKVDEVPTRRVVVVGNAEEGERLGNEWCSACHSVSPESVASDIGPTWRSIAADPAKTEDYLKTFLAAPHWPMENIALSNQEIADLIAYIETLASE